MTGGGGRFPAELPAYAQPGGAIRTKMIDVDATRDDSLRAAGKLWLAFQHLVDPMAPGDPAARPTHRVAFNPVERRRVPLGDVLGREVHERHAARRQPRHLATSQDVRFLPTVHQIPGTAENLTQATFVQHQVDVASEVGSNPLQLVVTIRCRLEPHWPQVSLKKNSARPP